MAQTSSSEDSSESSAKPSKQLLLVVLLLLVAAFVAVRVLALDADPPDRLPNGTSSRELWAEGAAKAHEARNWALWGAWKTHSVDNYQFWRAQAPVWVYSLAGFFKMFGVSTLVLRAHSIIVGAIGFVLVLLYGKKQLGLAALVACGVFLCGNYYYIHYTRVGLVEPMVNLFSAATLLCCHRALSRPLWLIAATWALVFAVFSKANGAYLLPIVAVCALVSLLRARRAGLPSWQIFVPIAHAAIVLLGTALYMTSGAYKRQAVWSVAHMVYDEHGQTEIDGSRINVGEMLARLFDAERWTTHFFPLFPIAAVLGLLAIIYTLRTFARNRTLTWDVLTLLWFAAAFASLQVTPRTFVRYYLVLFPPIALLGARGLELAMASVRRYRFAPAALLTVALMVFAAHESWQYVDWWKIRTYGVRDTNREVRRLIGERDDAVVVGLWSPWLVLDSPYKFYIVRNYFNVEKAALSQLGVTHLLLLPKDLSGSYVKRHFPRQFAKMKRLGSFRVYRNKLALHELQGPLK